MKKIIIGVFIGIFIITSIVIFINKKEEVSKFNDANTQKVLSYSDEIKNNNGQLIDVREPSEYELSHADGSINVPLGDIKNLDFSKIDSSRPIYLICRSGNRAGQAKIILEQAGYKNISNIGGLVDWENQGAKVCSSLTPSCT